MIKRSIQIIALILVSTMPAIKSSESILARVSTGLSDIRRNIAQVQNNNTGQHEALSIVAASAQLSDMLIDLLTELRSTSTRSTADLDVLGEQVAELIQHNEHIFQQVFRTLSTTEQQIYHTEMQERNLTFSRDGSVTADILLAIQQRRQQELTIQRVAALGAQNNTAVPTLTFSAPEEESAHTTPATHSHAATAYSDASYPLDAASPESEDLVDIDASDSSAGMSKARTNSNL